MLIMNGLGSKYKIVVEETDGTILYSICEGEKKRMAYMIDKRRPGWKSIWDETLAILMETMNSLEGGAGLQSRAFQRSPSTIS